MRMWNRATVSASDAGIVVTRRSASTTLLTGLVSGVRSQLLSNASATTVDQSPFRSFTNKPWSTGEYRCILARIAEPGTIHSRLPGYRRNDCSALRRKPCKWHESTMTEQRDTTEAKVADPSRHSAHECTKDCVPAKGVHCTIVHAWKTEGASDLEYPSEWWPQVAEAAGYGDLIWLEPAPEAPLPPCGPPHDPKGRVVVHQGAWRVWYRERTSGPLRKAPTASDS